MLQKKKICDLTLFIVDEENDDNYFMHTQNVALPTYPGFELSIMLDEDKVVILQQDSNSRYIYNPMFYRKMQLSPECSIYRSINICYDYGNQIFCKILLTTSMDIIISMLLNHLDKMKSMLNRGSYRILSLCIQ